MAPEVDDTSGRPSDPEVDNTCVDHFNHLVGRAVALLIFSYSGFNAYVQFYNSRPETGNLPVLTF